MTTSNSSKTSVLAVDDESDIINSIKQSFEVNGFQVCIFADTEAALDHFRSHFKNYEIVIPDIRMPGINGYELAKQVRKSSR